MLGAGLRLSLPVAAVLFALSACDAVPRDSDGTLDRVRGGTLRVGIARSPPWTTINESGEADGLEPELLDLWAEQLDARTVFREGAVADLVEALNRREIDVLAAGLVDDTPYASRLALSRPYLTTEDAYGQVRKHVLAVIPGESALLFSLDRFLAEQDQAALRARATITAEP